MATPDTLCVLKSALRLSGVQILEAHGLRRAGLFDDADNLLILSMDRPPADLEAACRDVMLLVGQPLSA